VARAKGTGEHFSAPSTEEIIGKFSSGDTRSPLSIASTKLNLVEKLAVPVLNSLRSSSPVRRDFEEQNWTDALRALHPFHDAPHD